MPTRSERETANRKRWNRAERWSKKRSYVRSADETDVQWISRYVAWAWVVGYEAAMADERKRRREGARRYAHVTADNL